MPTILYGCGGSTSGSSNGSNTEASSGSGVSKLSASQTCMTESCHGTQPSPGTGAPIVTEWKASTHNTMNGAGCADCHEPDSGHPQACSKCHGGGSGSVAHNPDVSGKCGKCHGIAFTNDIMMINSPKHFGNMTASLNNSKYRASYISSNYLGNCRKCHNPHDVTSARKINADWAESGHGNVTKGRSNYDFKTRGTYEPVNLTFQYYCVRCHTTTGYVNFVASGFTNQQPFAGPGYPVVQNAPVKVAPGTVQPADLPSTDKTKEVTGCDACHDDGKGRAYGYKVRSVAAFKAYYNFSSSNSSPTVKLNNKPVYYPDAGPSNVCIPCHVGRGVGSMIYDAAAAGMDFSNTNSPGAHDRAAGANLFQVSGYEFPGRSYASSTFLHSKIGMANFKGTGSRGPCVSCHMASDSSHSFIPVSEDSSGAVTGIISRTCSFCHNGSTAPTWTLAAFTDKKAGYQAALVILNKLRSGKVVSLPNKNSNYNQAYPGGGANTMGTSFNYSLLSNDPGAFAHNSLYTKRLLWDSIDWIYNGALDDDVVAAINSIVPSGTLTAETKAAAVKYLTTAPDGTTLPGRP